MMKLKSFLLLSALMVSLFTACGAQQSKEDDIAVAVAVALTTTAAAPKPAVAGPTPVVTNGTINGKVGIMAPPTPVMVVYALDPTTGQWASAETPANPNGMADFSLSVPPGSYQLFAFVSGSDSGGSAGYSLDGQGLSFVTVAPNQTVNNIMVQFPGQGDCGISYGLPASPDGKYKALTGPDPDCVAKLKANQQAASNNPATPTRVEFQANSTSWSTSGDLKAGQSSAFVLYALKGQTMTVTADINPSSGAYFYVRTAGGIILLPRSTTTWSGALPDSQDYVVGVDNLSQEGIHYTLIISIPPAGNASSTSSKKTVYSPVSASVCQTLQEQAANAISASFTLQASASFTDPLSQEKGTGCTLTATGTGVQFSEPSQITAALVKSFVGWNEQTSYQASGASGDATGMTRDMGLLLITAQWSPAPGVSCPSDRPIGECNLQPEQKIYVITIQAAQK
jgi:hypothetical protein